jgi:hypothetical protein
MRGTTQMNKRNYREIYLILNKLGKEYIDKIPPNIYRYIVENMDTEADQNNRISKETISFIAALHYKYWLQNKQEKEKFLRILTENQAKMNENNNLENMFKKGKNEQFTDIKAEHEPVNNMQLVRVEKWYNKVIRFFKRIFNIGDKK